MPYQPLEALDDAGAPLCRVLANGLSVISAPDHRAPTAVHMLVLRAGAMDETEGRSGAAHVLEHLMFKGTPSVPEGEFSRKVAALGGSENAYTSHETTVYHQQIPAHRLAEVMRLEADRLAHVSLQAAAFGKELEVVKEERRLRTDDNPRARLGELLAATAWAAAPHRRPVIGWMADLQALQIADVRDFYQRWYAPNNAALVVAGDVSPSQVLALAAQHYGAIAARALPVRKPQAEPAQAGPKRATLKAAAAQASVVLAYKVPQLSVQALSRGDWAASDRDALALTVLAALLDGYSGARLERALTQGAQPLADSVGAHVGLMARSPALFILSATPAQGQSAQAVEVALRGQIERIAREGVQPDELSRVKAQWQAAEVYKRDSVFNQAREIAQLWLLGAPLDTDARLLRALREVDAAQVQAVAARWFADDALTVATLEPNGAPPSAPRPPPSGLRH